MSNSKLNDPRYVPGASDVDDDMSDDEWVSAYGALTPADMRRAALDADA